MLTAEVESHDLDFFHPRPKRVRSLSGKHVQERSLDIVGVVDILKACEDYGGGVNCKVCGKLYKSRVCYIKHIWEHSVYWNMFDGEKNHDRVLSIQAALILYSGYHGNMENGKTLTDLLVTAPNEKKDESLEYVSPRKHKSSPTKKSSPLKRKKSFELE